MKEDEGYITRSKEDVEMTTRKGKYFILKKNAKEIDILQKKINKLRKKLDLDGDIKGDGFILKRKI